MTSNVVFNRCTQEKSDALQVTSENLSCFYDDANERSTDCDNVICTSYSTSECGNDYCGIGVCEVLNNQCRKNADGDVDEDGDGNNDPDCEGTEAEINACESDYFPPEATITSSSSRGIVYELSIEIYDKTTKRGPVTKITSGDYLLYFCLDGENCPAPLKHPFDYNTTSSSLTVSNLELIDGNDVILNLNRFYTDGASTIKYYAQDSNKNIGSVEEISFNAFSTGSPPIPVGMSDPNSLLIINGVEVYPASDGNYYVTSINTITITFVGTDPQAVVTTNDVKLIKQDGSEIHPSNAGIEDVSVTGTGKTFKFTFDDSQDDSDDLEEDTYTFDLYASNIAGIYMFFHYQRDIVIDTTPPDVTVTIEGTEIDPAASLETFDQSSLTIDLDFDDRVTIQNIFINGKNSIGNFTQSTTDDTLYSATMDLLDGPKTLTIISTNYANMQSTKTVRFSVNSNPIPEIEVISPSYLVSNTEKFTFIVKTDNKAVCGYNTGPTALSFNTVQDTMTADNDGLIHTADDNDTISHGQTKEFHVKCKDSHTDQVGAETFEISVDTTEPIITQLFMQPSVAIEASDDDPANTKIRVETDDETRCNYSIDTPDNMVPFDDFEEGFNTVNDQEITIDTVDPEDTKTITFHVTCENKAELVSSEETTSFTVDPSIDLIISASTMKEYYLTTSVELLIGTNLATQCSYKREGSTQLKYFSSQTTTDHRDTLSGLAEGTHTYEIECFWKGDLIESEVTFTVDLSPPEMQFVEDTSTFNESPDISCNDDKLRVKWLAEDDGSGVDYYTYSIIKEAGIVDEPIVNATQAFWESEDGDEWTWIGSLSLEEDTTYYFEVNATDYLLFTSAIESSDGIKVDTSNIICNITTCIDSGNCATGAACTDNSDCTSNFCPSNVCTETSCSDNIENQDETDIDCGGSCNKCQINQTCNVNSDCQSTNCEFGSCKEPDQCTDGQLGIGEASVDCGGICATKCSAGKNCDDDDDCKTGLWCGNSVCKSGPRDTDGDGIPDQWENQHGLDPNDPSDASQDPDRDGLTNREEYTYGTDPNKADTDGDEYSDKEEIDKNSDPLDPEDKPKSKLGFILLIIFLVVLLIAGSYFGYVYYTKRKEETKIPAMPVRRPAISAPRAGIAAPRRMIPQQPRQMRLRGTTKREEEKRRQRAKLFEKFGGKAEKPEKKKPPVALKKPVEEIKKVKEQVKKLPTKQKEDNIQKLKELSKKTKQEKIAKEDVFKQLKKIAKTKKKKK